MKLVFDHVSKSFGLINALSDISFTIKKGEFAFVVGPSGSGKSTLVKLILGQITPTDGQILIDGQVIDTRQKKFIDQSRKKIGVIFQDFQLITDKSIEENIALALDIIKYPKDKINSRIDHVLSQVNLDSRRLLYPAQLSGGELQRASLARALAIKPELILADEPTGNLDNENAWNLVKILKDINQNTKTSILMTTHNLDIVKSMDKRIIYLKNGKLKKDSQPKTKKK